MNAEIWKKKTNPKQIKTGKLNKNGEISTKSYSKHQEESEVQISMRLVNIDDVDTIVK